MGKIVELGSLAAVVFMAGCASVHMSKAERPSQPPGNDKALIVFMRPSMLGGAIQASVFDLQGSEEKFIGIVSAKTKVAYYANPGEHLFMVVGENADFMKANLLPGRTYHALVSPRFGVWKARFSLLPIHNDASAKYSLKSKDFDDWHSSCELVELSSSAQAWYMDNKASIAQKKEEYLQTWNSRSEADKADLVLFPQDGLASAVSGAPSQFAPPQSAAPASGARTPDAVSLEDLKGLLPAK
jgi:hypothetical protein